MAQQGKYSNADVASAAPTGTYSAADVAGGADQAAAPQTMLQRIGHGADDLAKGVGEGALSTISSADDFAAKHLPRFMTTPIGQSPTKENQDRSLATTQDLATPANTLQKIGKGTEQAGEFLLPTGLEEGAAKLGGAALGRGGEISGRLLGSGVHSGTINKVQGGDFATGAAAGVGGSVTGSGLKKIAPIVAETALKVRGADRAFGATPGRALLDETTGYAPRKIVDTARESMNGIQKDVGNMLSNTPGEVDLSPARGILNDFVDKAAEENHPGTYKDIGKLRDQLHTYHAASEDADKTISPFVRPSQAAALNRGISNAITSWNPAVANDTMNAAGKMAHHALGESIAEVAPEIRPLNQRMASLRPIIQRGNAADLNAGATQRTLDRLRAHTGALAGAGIGAGYGYHEGGLPGAALGFGAGLALPELLSSPETQMMAARTFNSPALRKIGIPAVAGAGLQFGHPGYDEQEIEPGKKRPSPFVQ
jgi:hypothetical protein